MSIATIISCSDWTDVAQAEVEIAALKHAPEGTRFISVPVVPFSAINCAFNVRLVAEGLPEGAIIIASADPRAPGLPREPLAINFNPKNMYLVCPNIGIPTLLRECAEPIASVRLHFPAWKTSVFNGRDLYAPVAGRLAAGCSLEEVGEKFPLSSICYLKIRRGQVLHIDNYGNVKIYAYDSLVDCDKVSVNGRQVRVAVNHTLKSGELVPEGELVATNGSSFGLVEFQVKAVREGATGASQLLGVKVGDVIDFHAQ